MDEKSIEQIDIALLQQKIKTARAHARKVFEARANLAGVLVGVPGIAGAEVVFPDVDLMHIHQTMFGRRIGEPLVFRLSFGRQLKWICVNHPWGLKAADVVIPEDRKDYQNDVIR